MKRILITVVAIMMVTSPIALAQEPPNTEERRSLKA